MVNKNFLIENGNYIPILSLFTYYFTNDLFLSCILYLKLFPANFYYFFGDLYDYLPEGYNFLIQFVRFTDTGHIASFLYYIDNSYIGLSFNVHFLITLAYWIGVFAFNLKESKIVEDDRIINSCCDIHSTLNHSVPLILFTSKIIYSKPIINPFTFGNIYNTYVWILYWFILIYIPWRIITGDPVYSIFDIKKTSFNFIVKFILIFFLLVIVSNYIGFIIFYFS